MNINIKVRYQFEVSAREFSIIRRALSNFGHIGDSLVSELLERQRKALAESQRHFNTLVEASVKDEEPHE